MRFQAIFFPFKEQSCYTALLKTKKEAVAKVKKDEKKAEPKVQKVTCLYKPALSAGKAPKQAKQVTKKWALDSLSLAIC